MITEHTSGQVVVDTAVLLQRIQAAVHSLDSLFGQIVVTSQTTTSCLPARPVETWSVDRSQLTAAQCNAVVQLSGHLQCIHDYVYSAKLKALHQNSIFRHLPMKETTLDEKNAVSDRISVPNIDKDVDNGKNKNMFACLQQTNCLLQQYLVNELNHSEELENQLKQAERVKMQLIDELNLLRQKLNNQKVVNAAIASTNTSGSSSGSGSFSSSPRKVVSSPAEETITKIWSLSRPMSMIGQFVRKAFGDRQYFGVVGAFRKPYYMVSFASTEANNSYQY
jgi:hypothetical protein